MKLALLTVMLCGTRAAAAQEATAQIPASVPASVPAPTPRPTIAIAAFDTDRTGWVPPPNFGETVADLLASRLVDLGGFRVFDRALLPERGPSRRVAFDDLRAVAAQSGVDYVVLGAVTRFGNEKKNSRGGLLGIPFLGGGGKSTQESTVGLTLRVVNVRTGEIVTTSTSLGAAGKSTRTIAGGALVRGLPVGGLFSSSGSGSLDRLVSEALLDAVEDAAATLTKAAVSLAATGGPA
jgi:curli biogenesis system outer membrane secretion channel CsgG